MRRKVFLYGFYSRCGRSKRESCAEGYSDSVPEALKIFIIGCTVSFYFCVCRRSFFASLKIWFLRP